MAKLGYLRVSKQEQRPDRQIDGLQGRCDRLFIETLSAVSQNRPVYEAILQDLAPGDTLVVWDLDRAFRSAKDALNEADRLMGRGVYFEVVSLPINTATDEGWFFYTLVSAFAELERRILVRRTKEGLKAARERGQILGRPSKLSHEQLSEANRRLSETDDKVAHIAKEFHVAPWTLTRALRRYANGPQADAMTSESNKQR
jgi:DNA invertase Pin-like site-specific DNA recombinase